MEVSNSGGKGRVCIGCLFDTCYYSFYILDFDADSNRTGSIEKWPLFRLDYEPRKEMSICVTDPYLFVIGGVGGVDILVTPGKVWMSRYDLRSRFPSESTAIPIHIGSSDLEEGLVAAMNSPKFRPGITASPDGSSVVVYSQCIEFSGDTRHHFENHDVDFEVFDTHSQEWSPLPQLILCLPGGGPDSFLMKRSYSDHWIGGGLGGHLWRNRQRLPGLSSGRCLPIDDVKFINGNTLLVALNVGLLFTLNIDSREQGWELYGDEHIPRVLQLHDFVLFGREPLVVVTSFEVKVVRRKDKEEEEFRHQLDIPFHLAEIETPHLFPERVVSVLKYVENKECVACIFNYAVDASTRNALLICDLFKFDLRNGNGNDCRPTPLGCYRYVLSKSSSYFSVDSIVPFSTQWQSIESQKRRKLAHGTSSVLDS